MRHSLEKMRGHQTCKRSLGGILTVPAVAALCVVLPRQTLADVSPLPRSRSEAVLMERRDELPRTAFYDTPSLESSKPGDLLRKEATAAYSIPKGATAIRFLYHSLAADGSDVATSGVVLTPPGTPPAGGWPIIAWAHGTSGVARMCAPSLMKDLDYGEEGLMPMVRAGFAVVATDYHGLGTAGPHQYANKIAQGRDVLYSVPAARAAVPALGRPWVVVGHSQGGLAAWSVAEMQATLQDPNYHGSVSIAGAADLRDILASMSASGKDAAFYLTYMAYAVRAGFPTFEPSQMLAGKALERYPDVTSNGCWNYGYATFLDISAEPIVKPGWDQIPAVIQFFKSNELGTVSIAGPLLVIAGEADRTVPINSMRAVVQRACKKGISLTFRSYPGLDHDPTMDRSTQDFLSWIRDRLAGKPVLQGCAGAAGDTAALHAP